MRCLTVYSSPVMQTTGRISNEISGRLTSFFLLYFLQGMPYGIQTRFLPLQLRKVGMSLTNLGYFRMVLAPWVLKGLWAPIIDRTGDLKMFVCGSHIVLVALSLIASQFTPEYITVLGVVLFLIHLSVAVQDIALDGLLIDLLTPAQLVAGNMVQVIGYKLGSIVSGGFFGFFTEIAGWDILFLSLAGMYALGYMISVISIPSAVQNDVIFPDEDGSETQIPVNSNVSSMLGFDDTNSVPMELSLRQRRQRPQQSIYQLVDIEGTMWLLPFVFLYKCGDQGVSSLFPMFMIDAGLDMAEVAFWGGCVGQVFSLAGSVVGGVLRKTMIGSIRILLVAQAISVFILWLTVIFWKSSELIYYVSLAVLMLAQLASGGVTTCTFTLIMQLSQKVPRRFRTSHYTLLATSEVAGRLVTSTITGIVTDHTSYVFTFGLLTFASVIILPSLLFVPRALIIEV